MSLDGNNKPINPQAAALAKRYVAEIRKLCGWPTVTEELPKSCVEVAKELPKNFQETARDWQVDDEDLEALKEIPF